MSGNSLIATAKRKGYIKKPEPKKIEKTPHPESNEGLRRYSIGRSGITFRFYNNFSFHDVHVVHYSSSVQPEIKAQYYSDGSVPSVLPTFHQNIHHVQIGSLPIHLVERITKYFQQGVHLSVNQNGHEVVKKAYIKDLHMNYSVHRDEQILELNLVQVE